MKRTVDDETREIITSFIAEGYERLDDAEAQLIGLGGADDTAKLNSVFRLFHSVKGSAGYLGFEAVKGLTHEAESLLEYFIKGKLAVPAESLDLIYQTIDALRKAIQIVESDYADDEAAAASAEQADRVRGHLAALKAPRLSPNEIVLNELVSAEMVQRFLAESADLIDEAEKRVLQLDGAADGKDLVNDIFRSIHTIKGNAGFFGFARLAEQCMDLESQLDQARQGKAPINEALANAVINRIDSLRGTIAEVKVVEEGSAPPPPAAGTGSAAPASAAQNAAEAAAATAAGPEYRPLGEILVDIGAARAEEVQDALETQDRPLGQILVESGVVKDEDIARALDIQKASGAAERAPVEEIQRREIRVDTVKLDKLFDLVGELITAEAMVLNSQDLVGLKLDNFTKSFANLNKISREIQETTMMVRMIPLEGLFHKMTRLVRDLSRKFDKPVELTVTGQDTEMDKNVIEQISDPLVHILRNSIDHGIEAAAFRADSGKPKTGAIGLHARYEGSEIWISITDDGAGLSRERIVAKGIEKGMIKPEDAAALPDAEVWKLIFEPGFSTAAVVTEVSGRGVGMDVVKKNLERIRGKVDIHTAAGRGSEFILKIPLTMAIIDGITIRCGSNYYSIPLSDILEFFKASANQITETEKGQDTINLRGRIMPLIKLAEVFNIAGANVDPTEGSIIVVHNAGRQVCLLIDEVVGNQQIVVKSLSEYLGKLEGISGCSILGDGTVSFIIDTARLIARRIE